jgi:hypothetical protein
MFQLLAPPTDLIPSTGEEFWIKPATETDIQFATALGYQYVNDYSETGWIRLTASVGWHQDTGGRTFLYCAKGAGALHVSSQTEELDKAKAISASGELLTTPKGIRAFIRKIFTGGTLCFDSQKYHKFELLEPECILLILSVK